MSKKNLHYVWTYFTKGTNETCAMCKICDKTFLLQKIYSKVLRHIQIMHSSDDSTVTSKISNSQKKIKNKKDKKRPFSITEDQAKCDFCKKSFNIYYSISENMKHHLKTIHKIDKNKAQKHRKLCHEHVKRSSRKNTMTCNYCEKVFQNNNYFTLMIHLINVHEIDISLEIRSKELNDGSSCLPDIEVNDIVTPSCLSNTEINDTYTLSNLFDTEVNDIVTSNFLSNIEVNDTDTLSNLFDTEVNDIVTSNFLSNTEVNDTDILSNLFDTEVNDIVTSNFLSNTEINDINTSSTYQQSHTTYSFEYNLNNSSKSNRNAENIATLSSYQQPTFSSDDSFNCDDHDNIDNFDSLAEECLKECLKDCLKELKK